ncbi:MAG: hypothetical protein WA989_08555 [Henriciella sp.]|uniref:hypothetical protein n=1 Tax=Henriciella sp. TaxID=1968823 RepID=UPI003C748B49
MAVYIYAKGIMDAKTIVETAPDHVILKPPGKPDEMIAYEDLSSLRWYHVSTQRRHDYGLVFCAKGRKHVMNFVSIAGGGDGETFNAAVADILGAIGKARPDLQVKSGVSPAASWTIFLASALPAVLGLTFGLVLIGEPGATGPAIGGLLIGGLFAHRAWRHRAWKKRETISAGELADLFAA